MKSKSRKRGITLVEIILVVTLIASALGFGAIYYRSSALRYDIRTQASEFVAYLRLVQSNADAGLNGSSHGVHLDQSSYTIFVGDTYDSEDTTNYTIDLPDIMKIDNINLNGGGSDIVFSGPNGETLNYGTLDFVAEDINKTITVTISLLGSVNY